MGNLFPVKVPANTLPSLLLALHMRALCLRAKRLERQPYLMVFLYNRQTCLCHVP